MVRLILEIFFQTCRTTTKFDCSGYESDFDSGSGSGGYGAEEKDYCKRTYPTTCYDTPRVVNNEVCYPQQQKLCEKLVNSVPYPKEKQVCHNDEKKVCELEQRTQPKQVIY